MTNKIFETTIKEIVDAMKEKGYEPYEQLEGYAQFKILSFITRHKDARDKIQKLDIAEIQKYLKEQGR